MQRWRPRLAPEFVAAARAYAFDLAATAALYVGASLAAGRVWRFPFDDEVYTLDKIESFSVGKIVGFYLTGHDVHPPLSYLFAKGLYALGLSEPGMRLVSVALTALTLVLFHWMTLVFIAARRGAPPPATRIIAVLVFGLCALAVSQGAAIRWYPLFAAEVAAALALYLGGANGATQLAAASLLGLAASTNFLAALVIVPLAVYRYVLERRFSPLDAAMAALFLIFGSLGACTALYLLFDNARMVGTQLTYGVGAAAAVDVLGFFGGHALGLGQAWLVAPAALIGVAAVIAAIEPKRPAAPAHLLLMMLAVAALLALGGFGKPRSFLYLAPVMAALVVMLLDRLDARRGRLAPLLAATWLVVSVAAISQIADSRHPFKREAVIPYGEVLDFIAAHGEGRTLVLSTDPVVTWLLDHGSPRPERCASYFLRRRDCFSDARRYDTVITIVGHSHLAANGAVAIRFATSSAQLIADKRKAATFSAGVDEDAALKSRLTGVPLSREILAINVYR